MEQSSLKSLLGVESSKWMMHPSERLVILGLLSVLRPKCVLEFGCAEGGLTYWLSQYCQEVVTVDLDPKVLAVTKGLANVTPLCMTTLEAAKRIESEGTRYDLTIIDADHSQYGVQRDLENAMRFSKVVVLHDTFYPPCREGILAALADRDIYYNLDLVQGGLQPDGCWGGLGIVVPGIKRKVPTYITPRLSPYPWLQRLWSIQQFTKVLHSKIGRLFRRLLTTR